MIDGAEEFARMVRDNELLRRRVAELETETQRFGITLRSIGDAESLAKFSGENPNPVLRLRHDGRISCANEGSRDLLTAWNCAVGDCVHPRLRDALVRPVAPSGTTVEEVTADGRVFSIMVEMDSMAHWAFHELTTPEARERLGGR